MKGGTGGLRSLEAEEGHRQLCSILFSFIPPPALPPLMSLFVLKFSHSALNIKY